MAGVTRAGVVGGRRYERRGRLDAGHGVSSWREAVDWLHAVAPGRPIGEIQFWGHGQWGGLWIDEELLASDWQLNDIFPDIHLPTGAGATLIGDRVVYLGSAGPFAYGLDDGVIAPVLLEARWDPTGEAPRIEYVDPLPLANSRLLVRGLEGSAGEIGSAGPVYSVELP